MGYQFKEKDEQIEFLVRWKGYEAAHDTWESFDMFAEDAPDIVQKYLINEVFKKHGLPRTSKKSKEEEKQKSEDGNSKNKGDKTESKENETKIKIISQL